MTELTLNLKHTLAKDVPLRIRHFLDDIALNRQFAEFTQEEIFMPASTYAFLQGVKMDNNTPLPELVLLKGDDDSVGALGDYPCRSNIFSIARQRDDENVPELALRYRAW